MITRSILSLSILSFAALSLSGCMDLKPYQQEGEYYRQQVIAADKITAEEHARMYNTRPATTNIVVTRTQTDSESVLMDKDNVRTSDRFMGANTLGNLKTYDPPAYSRPNLTNGQHQQELRRIEKRQQQEIYNSSRLRK